MTAAQTTASRKSRGKPKLPRFGSPEWEAEMKARDRWVQSEELRDADGYGLAPWEMCND